MKSIKLVILLLTITIGTFAQDVVYATDLGAEKIKKISANPITGVTTGSFTNVKSILSSAALGADANGWLYYLEYGIGGTGEGDGKVDVYATRADGTGSPTRIANNADINGASNSELGFVRLGIDATNTAWILSSNSSGTLYLAKFPANGSSNVTVTTVTSNITTSDNTNDVFKNGDLAFTAGGTMYVLANNDATNTTKIYTIVPSSIPINGSGTLQYRWTVKKDNGTSVEDFSNRVNGVAFTSSGSMYISTDDGLYFLDQFSTNFLGSGTVKCSLVNSQVGLTDLATAYWPENTRLPIRFKSFYVRKPSEDIVEVEFTVEEAQSTSHFNVKVSKDGKTYHTVMLIFADGLKPENTYKRKIDLRTLKF
jgi:hypothetical protein